MASCHDTALALARLDHDEVVEQRLRDRLLARPHGRFLHRVSSLCFIKHFETAGVASLTLGGYRSYSH